MKTLAEFNRMARERYRASDDLAKPHKNGIACPQCGQELWDIAPMLTLTSNPPQKDIACQGCGYRGYRIA